MIKNINKDGKEISDLAAITIEAEKHTAIYRVICAINERNTNNDYKTTTERMA